MNALLDWYNQQTQRDQLVLKIGLSTVVLGIFYFAIFSPLYNGRNNLQKQITTAEENLVFLKEGAISFKQSSASGTSTSRLPASQIASSSARKFSVSLARIAPKRDNQTSLTIDEVKFNDLVSWLNDIQSKGLSVVSIDINKMEREGFVKASITVSGGAG
jgi:general secretion pathway protein M